MRRKQLTSLRSVVPIVALAAVLGLGLLAALPAASAPTAPLLLLQRATFDPLLGPPTYQPPWALSAGEAAVSAYRLIQFTGPIQETWLQALKRAGAQPQLYVPENGLLLRWDSLDSEMLALVATWPFVRWTGPIQPLYKLHRSLDSLLTGQAQRQVVRALSYQGVSRASLAGQLQAAGVVAGNWHGDESRGWILQLELSSSDLLNLLHVDHIAWVEPLWSRELLNDQARGPWTGVNALWGRMAAQEVNLYGNGQVIAVADTGLDTGNMATLSPDFAGRVLQAYALGRPPADWSDRNGHGTHVTGSAAGNGLQSGSDPATHAYAASLGGVAPEAGLVIQAVDDRLGFLTGIPDDLYELFVPPYAEDARIHSNSWGGPTGGIPGNPTYGGYTLDSMRADLFAWEHRDMVLLFAAGNAGTDQDGNGVVDLDGINAPATAKNVMAVGASENLRPPNGQACRQVGLTNCHWGDFGWGLHAEPIGSDWLSDDGQGMAGFSSRGPTDDGRIKPDLVAPGINVVSNRSHQLGASYPWGVYNLHYAYDGGTSMSTPLVAGAAALARQWTMDVAGLNSPSAALIKAILLSGAANPAPGQYGTGSAQEIPDPMPNHVVGWGRLDLAQALAPLPPQVTWLHDEQFGLFTGDLVELEFAVGWEPAATASAAGHVKPLQASQAELPPMPAVGLVPAELEYLVDGGFEQGSLDPHWQAGGTTHLVDGPVHGGLQAAQLGGIDNAVDRLRQLVQFPNDLTAVRLSFWHLVESAEPQAGADLFQAGFYEPVAGLPALIPFQLDAANASGQWVEYVYQVPINQLGNLAGRQLYLGFRLTTNGSSPTTAVVDDASLRISRPGDPTPTATATVTPTPTRTATPTPTATPTLAPGQPTPTPTPPAVIEPLQVTLVWTDYPGSPQVARQLVNDLDLVLVLPDGRQILGNDGNGLGEPDRLNPAEVIQVPEAPAGFYRVQVRAAQVPFGPQPFALVVRGAYLVRPSVERPARLWLPLIFRKASGS